MDTGQQVHDFPPALRVQITRGLICKNHIWLCNQRPGNGNPLLLSAGQLTGQVCQSMLQPQKLRDLLEISLIYLTMIQQQGHDNVLPRC